MKDRTLFWISIILILEPLTAIAWPRLKVGFFIANPRYVDHSDRINSYYDSCRDTRFGTYGTLRRRVRICLWSIGILILTALAANSIFDLNFLKYIH